MLTVTHDTTDLKLAEDELRRTRDQVGNILESITDAFFALDNDCRFTYLNREAERVLQRRADDLLGKTIWTEFPASGLSSRPSIRERSGRTSPWHSKRTTRP